MQLIRSLVFNIFLYIGLITIFILAIPTLVLPNKFTIFFGRLSAKYIVLILRIILNTKVIFHGIENLKKVDNYFIASAHQSMFETFALQIPLDGPIFILKKELLNIPIFGWYLKKIKSISIDRNKISKENLNFYEKIKLSYKNSNRPIIIFPQATRLKPDDRSDFKKGASRIYEILKLKCQPVAINSGIVWPKSGPLVPNKTITISILKPINSDLNSKEFLISLQRNIYKELDDLN